MERGDAASPLGRVHVSIDDERRFFESCSGLAVRERQEPHRTSLRCRPDAFQLNQIWARIRPRVEKLCQLVVAEDVIEGERCKCLRSRGQNQAAECEREKRNFHRRRPFRFASSSRIGRTRLNSARSFSAGNAVKPNTSPGRVGSIA